ncbi:biotin--[acetyl-CoA-carboxylase] ligase [Sporolactobacillus sp. THM7-4]|nr:biotin--[acetyl-CoA-carboxylase] ligase [Sporolactobacillus sp. THM7-4]
MVQSMAKTKQAVLKLLYENRDRYLSGQKISEIIGCSRTAVWKHIKDLIKDGYRINAVQKSGYQLIGAPEGLNEAALSAGLRTEKLGRHIYFYETIGSTQKEALVLADEGAADGTIVITNEQSAGRGRLGHTWQSARGVNVAMSMILRPHLPIEQTPQLTLITAVAACDVIEKVTGVSCGIKWPNDILFEGKKLVGILTELQAEATYVKAVVIGIGMNVNTDPETFSGELASRATSLKKITGKTYDLVSFVQAFLKRFEELYMLFLKEGFPSIKPLWERRATSLGKKIKVRQAGGKTIEGIARGINDQGVLLLEGENHRLTRVYSADIEWS